MSLAPRIRASGVTQAIDHHQGVDGPAEDQPVEALFSQVGSPHDVAGRSGGSVAATPP